MDKAAKWTENEIKEMLLVSVKAVCNALVRLLSFQTADEQNSERTLHHNGIGFNGYDGPLLSSFAKQVQAGRNLTDKQLLIARKRLIKYTKQLAQYANENHPKK